MGNTVSRKSYFFTSESVSEGHPDKVCDRISDEVVDLFFREGPKAGIDPWQLRVACETLATTNQVIIAGETRGPRASPGIWSRTWRAWQSRILATSRTAFIGIGPIFGCCCTRSPPISPKASIVAAIAMRAQAIRASCSVLPARIRPELMPAPIYYSHKILRLISEARHAGKEAVLGPDSKSQVTVRYENGKPVAATQIVVSHQHLVESITSAQVRELVEPYVRKALAERLDQQGHGLARQSDGQISHRRPGWRLRADRTQDHRRYLWRGGPPRRGRLLGQGPHQG